MDFALLIYFLIAIVSGYGVALFIWGWIKEKSVSHMYGYVTFLFLAIMLNNAVNLYTRLLTLNNDLTYLFAWWWPLRMVGVLICIMIIVIHMTIRTNRALKRIRKYEEIRKNL